MERIGMAGNARSSTRLEQVKTTAKELRKQADEAWAAGDKAECDHLHAVARRVEEREKAMNEISFRPGKYTHYKGGHYAALMLVRHHETREPMVVYVSEEKGNVQVRELRQPSPRADGSWPHIDAWTDIVEWPDGVKRPRFLFAEDFS